MPMRGGCGGMVGGGMVGGGPSGDLPCGGKGSGALEEVNRGGRGGNPGPAINTDNKT